MINIRRVIEYAWQILKAQGGNYPYVENMIRQAELDANHIERLLKNAEHSVHLTALGRGRREGFLVGVIVSAIVVYATIGGR